MYLERQLWKFCFYDCLKKPSSGGFFSNGLKLAKEKLERSDNMKKFNTQFKDKRLELAIADLRRFKFRWGRKSGAVLLDSALSQIEAGEVDFACKTIERFELVGGRLSRSDRALLQSMTERLKLSLWQRVGSQLQRACSVLVRIISSIIVTIISSAAWDWIRTLLHNYFRHGFKFSNIYLQNRATLGNIRRNAYFIGRKGAEALSALV